MAKGFKHGAGGVGLNFKVVCNPQPANPRENTIWIDTDRINNTHFSSTQPENMADYDVWISTGTSSTVAFFATKKNPVMVYPVSAKQMVSGALVDKAAKSYQGGEWVDWILWLYNSGITYAAFTGNLVTVGKAINSSVTGANPLTITWNATNIKLTQEKGSSVGVAYFEKKIDLTNYRTLKLQGVMYTPSSNATYAVRMRVLRSMSGTYADDDTAVMRSGSTSTASSLYTLDVSNLTGEHYIGFSIWAYDASAYITIDKLWIE